MFQGYDKIKHALIVMNTHRDKFGKTVEDFDRLSEEEKIDAIMSIRIYVDVLYADNYTEDEVKEVLEKSGIGAHEILYEKRDEFTSAMIKKIYKDVDKNFWKYYNRKQD